MRRMFFSLAIVLVIALLSSISQCVIEADQKLLQPYESINKFRDRCQETLLGNLPNGRLLAVEDYKQLAETVNSLAGDGGGGARAIQLAGLPTEENFKTMVQMLASVPPEKRTTAEYRDCLKALDYLALFENYHRSELNTLITAHLSTPTKTYMAKLYVQRTAFRFLMQETVKLMQAGAHVYKDAQDGPATIFQCKSAYEGLFKKLGVADLSGLIEALQRVNLRVEGAGLENVPRVDNPPPSLSIVRKIEDFFSCIEQEKANVLAAVTPGLIDVLTQCLPYWDNDACWKDMVVHTIKATRVVPVAAPTGDVSAWSRNAYAVMVALISVSAFIFLAFFLPWGLRDGKKLALGQGALTSDQLWMDGSVNSSNSSAPAAATASPALETKQPASSNLLSKAAQISPMQAAGVWLVAAVALSLLN